MEHNRKVSKREDYVRIQKSWRWRSMLFGGELLGLRLRRKLVIQWIGASKKILRLAVGVAGRSADGGEQGKKGI